MADYNVYVVLWTILIGYSLGAAHAEDRVYYIGAVESEWNYAPSGLDNITGDAFTPNTSAGDRMLNGESRIGSIYKKALFREYTDDSFTTQSTRPPWLGIMGPVLRAEVGDMVIVHFRNMASRPFSINPSGLTYTKSSEGALYSDGTSGSQKADDTVEPNQTYIYRWDVTAKYAGPKAGGENCIAWPYSSHRFNRQDMNAGLIGVTVVCNRGFLSSILQDIVLLYGVFDENKSWYIGDNKGNFAPGVTETEIQSDGFVASNKLYTVNGLSYGNLPGLEVCQGHAVRWFIFTFGDETSLHSVFFNGNPLEYDGKRADTVPLIPGPVSVVNMQADNPGTWLLSSLSTSDAKNGGSALYTVKPDCVDSATSESGASSGGNVFRHFIAIEELDWNYAPYVSKSPSGHGPVFRKALYVAYTDNTFRTKKQRSQEDSYLGFVGPVIRAEVGDHIEVTLKNSASRPYNIHPNNVMYDKANEGWQYADGLQGTQKGDAVPHNQSHTYNWTIPSSYGPTTNDPDCITGVYYSTYGGERDLHSGLIGPLIVCKAGTLHSNGTQANVDREVVTMVVSLNEELSWYAQQNQDVRYNDDFPAAEIRTINGFVSDNLHDLSMCEADLVSWHAPCIGNEETYMGLHIPYQTFSYRGRRVNTLPLLPGQTEEATFRAEGPGSWVINGNVYNYDLEVNYTVLACSTSSPAQSKNDQKERTIYLAAEEQIWDYAPTEYDYIRNQSLTYPQSTGYDFVKKGATLIGRRYKKARFVEYTDDSFQTPATRSYWEQHLGILGPFIRAEVDETVKIVFKNKAQRPYSLNAHNLPGQVMEYMGQTYDEPLPVPPGKVAIYRWTMLEKAGPTDDQPNCIVWPYYSSIITKKDTNSGMIAPLVVCRDGTLNDEGERTDVDRDFALLFTTFDENDNWYLDDNIATFAGQPELVDKEDAVFENSNDAFSINGYIYGFPLNISMAVGERVAWYIITVGGGADVHSINFHGHTVTEQGQVTKNLDTVATLPGDFITVEMEVQHTGTWLLHDSINSHAESGSETRYTVYARKEDIPCGSVRYGPTLWTLLTIFVVFIF